MANYKLKINGLLGGERSWSIGWNGTSGSDEITVATALHDAWNTLWTTAATGLENFLNAEVTTVNVSAATNTAVWRQTSITKQALALAGTNSHDSLPWNSSVTISHFSAIDARFGRGRIELPCLSNDNLTSHVYLDATLASIATRFAAFWVTMNGTAGLTPVVFNRKPLKDGTGPFIQHALLSGEPSNKPGTVRARTRKVIPVKAHSFAM